MGAGTPSWATRFVYTSPQSLLHGGAIGQGEFVQLPAARGSDFIPLNSGSGSVSN